MSIAPSRRAPWLVKGDLDGFFGLAVDNLVQVLVICALCSQLCGFGDTLLYTRVLPGVAVSLFIGNVYYALHARRMARKTNNPTITALPYGINTPSVFAYIFFIMAPVYGRYKDVLGVEGAADLAWKAGLVACVGSGLIEFLGAFIGERIRRVTPRAGLLSALAAIGVILIAGPFAFQIFERPLVAVVPMFVVLVGYFARVRFPLGLPSGLVAVVLGSVLAWTVPLIPHCGPPMMSAAELQAAASAFSTSIGEGHIYWPQQCWQEIVALFQYDSSLLWAFLGVIVPMGLINAIGSLQNIESAEAAGDRFATGPCMAVNGIGSIAAGLFGSCFPTTIYIGHPGWKALGARTGYSIINAVFFSTVFLLGLGMVVVKAVPMEAGMAIVMWIGVVITAQSYAAVPKRHYAAVAIAFFPAVAMMATLYLPQMLRSVGATQGIMALVQTHGAMLENAAIRTDEWWPVGLYALAGANSGFIITCIFISAISAFLIDRRFKTAGIWCLAAMITTLLGFQHAFRIEPDPPGRIMLTPQELLVWQRSEATFEGTSLYLVQKAGAFWHRGYRIAAGYGAAAVLLFGIHALRRRGRGFEDIAVDLHDGPTPDEGEPGFDQPQSAEVNANRAGPPLGNRQTPPSASPTESPGLDSLRAEAQALRCPPIAAVKPPSPSSPAAMLEDDIPEIRPPELLDLEPLNISDLPKQTS